MSEQSLKNLKVVDTYKEYSIVSNLNYHEGLEYALLKKKKSFFGKEKTYYCLLNYNGNDFWDECPAHNAVWGSLERVTQIFNRHILKDRGSAE